MSARGERRRNAFDERLRAAGCSTDVRHKVEVHVFVRSLRASLGDTGCIVV